MKTLIQLILEYQELGEQLEFDELTPELEEQLAINRNNLEEKVEDYIQLIDTLQSENENLSKKADRIKELKDKNKKTIDFLRAKLLMTTKLYGIDNKNGNKNLKVGMFSLTQKINPFVVIDNPALVPDEFKETVEEVKIDKKGLYNFLKDNPFVGYAHIDKKSSESLIIK